MSTEVALLIPTARTRMFTLFKHPSNPSRYESEQVRDTKVKRQIPNEDFRRVCSIQAPIVKAILLPSLQKWSAQKDNICHK